MNAQVSVVTTFGPDDDDTIEHVILKTCDVVGCEEIAAYYDKFCPRCRDEIDALGLDKLPEYAPRSPSDIPTNYHSIIDAIRAWVKQ